MADEREAILLRDKYHCTEVVHPPLWRGGVRAAPRRCSVMGSEMVVRDGRAMCPKHAAEWDAELHPEEGWAYVGCPTCGNVTTVPLERLEPPPWCVHSGSTITWRDPHPEQQAGPRPWTRTGRVRVRPELELEASDG